MNSVLTLAAFEFKIAHSCKYLVIIKCSNQL